MCIVLGKGSQGSREKEGVRGASTERPGRGALEKGGEKVLGDQP